MAQKFKLIQRRNLGKDAAVTPTKMYAQAVNNGYVSFDELCADISELCSLTSADVKAVMDRMNYVLDRNLKAGRIVQLFQFKHCTIISRLSDKKILLIISYLMRRI